LNGAKPKVLKKLLFAATLLLFLPTYLWLIDAWLSDPYYSHGPLVLIIALYLAWARRAALHAPAAPSNAGWLLILIALAAHLGATLWRAYYISALMIPLAFLGLGITLYGWRIARQFLFPLAFLILMVPLPLAERIGPLLEQWATMSAVVLVQLIGVAAQNIGAQVLLPNSTFTVGIPCGGLRSAVAILTLATLLAYIVQGRAWARLAIFLAAIPIALAANTIRIALLFAVANVWGPDAAIKYFHDWSSPILFACAFAFIILLAKLLGAAQIRWEVVFPQ
jgi:exosortase